MKKVKFARCGHRQGLVVGRVYWMDLLCIVIVLAADLLLYDYLVYRVPDFLVRFMLWRW